MELHTLPLDKKALESRGNGWFMLANYILIISAFIHIFKFQKKKKR